MVVSARERAYRVASASKEIVRPVFRKVSDFVREGVILITESVNVHDVSYRSSIQRSEKNNEYIGTHEKLKVMSEDTAQFKQIKESIRERGIYTHAAIKQVIPDIIDTQYQQNKINERINREEKQNLPANKSSQQNMSAGVSIKSEKNGSTWVYHSNKKSTSNPIRRRSVFDDDINNVYYKKTYLAQGA